MKPTTQDIDAQPEPEHPDAYARLGALMTRLHVHGMTTVLQRRSLIVINARGDGEGDPAQPSDTLTCGPREDDGGRLWFFGAWGNPIAEAGDIVGAAVVLTGKLQAS
ncbi:hypothetical protein [Actinomadura roseirufa]|uniref:hypothetical protein n=1 Tax=Actinomadura roseirufa TaxID=2094049 RepID=UPI00104159D0|nr:hypothetical protein [Actinomadura roseirufa]